MYLEQGIPTVAVNLSQRLRELRRRQGKTQSDISRRLGVDPSIPSLWEQGKRPVPPQRMAALADALEISLSELLRGVVPDSELSEVDAEFLPLSAPEPVHESAPVGITPPPLSRDPSPIAPSPFDRALPLDGDLAWTPDGWSTSDRLAALADELPEGLWLDPARIDRPSSRRILRDRLCPADRGAVGERAVGGGALADRIAQHCSRLAGWHGHFPLAEALFREVLASDQGGLEVSALAVAVSRRRPGEVPTVDLVRRLGSSLRGAYPVRWVTRSPVGAASLVGVTRTPSAAET
jgi:transcriptional regulator with XRE-family HTH domain